MADTDKKLYLIDISSFIFRAFYAVRHLSNSRGEPTNAVYGVANMLIKLFEDAKPTYVGVLYDSKEPSFRKEIYTEYKANRSAPPDDLIPQFDRIEQLVSAMGIHSFRQPGVEADDLIASVARKWAAQGKDYEVVIVSGDKDLMQLVDQQITVWDTMKNIHYDESGVEEKFGIKPNQVRDYLSLVGDSSDNIPGIPSIGPKSAVSLLLEHQTMEGVIEAAKAGKIKGKKGEVIAQNEEKAKLSQTLVSLKEELELKFKLEDFHADISFNDEIAKFLKELEFHGLLERWEKKTGSTTESKKPEDRDFRGATLQTIQDEKELSALVDRIKKQGWFAFDLETTSLNPREAEIVGYAIALNAKEGFYVPVTHRGTNEKQVSEKKAKELFKEVLEDEKVLILGQNLKYDFSIMQAAGVLCKGILADTMVAAYVLDPSGRHGLDFLARKYLDYQPISFESVTGSGKDQLGFDQVDIKLATQYAAEDALVTVWLWELFEKELKESKLMSILTGIDLPLVPILQKMEMQGVSIDQEFLKKLSLEFDSELEQLQKKIEVYSEGPININSPKQLQTLLFEKLKLPVKSKTKTGPSTDAKVLQALSSEHEVPRLLMEFRELSKLKGTYVDPLPKLVSPITHKIHASFHQTVAATGRLSSSDPNLQNIPIRTKRGQMIRRAFIPSKGNVLLAADYSQIELRILAHMSQDEDLVTSFRNDEDIHRRTASEIFEIPTDKIDDHQRSIAKAINFGLMYGKTAFGLSQELKISMKEAKEMITKYFERYFKVKQFLDGLIESAKKEKATFTLMGRRRLLPEIDSKNPMVRNNAERIAMNTPLQGTASDLIKIAMKQLDQRLEDEGLKSKLIIQVHDELLLDCPKDELEIAKKVLVQEMEGAMSLSVPLKAEAYSGENWMEI